MKKLSNKITYTYWVWLHQLKSVLKGDIGTGLENAIGGNFNSLGRVMSDLLIHHGLQSDGYLIDVGCGAGRLTKFVESHLANGRYLGIDIIPRLLKHASKQTNNPNFEFKTVSDLKIPEEDISADMVCFFSVFTHLLHEETFLYLEEAKRVLKHDGTVVFSFLDFEVADHWPVFENNIKNTQRHFEHLNMFIGRDAINCWADRLGFSIVGIWKGDEPHIPLSEDIITDEGTKMESMGWLGQSVCVLRKN